MRNIRGTRSGRRPVSQTASTAYCCSSSRACSAVGARTTSSRTWTCSRERPRRPWRVRPNTCGASAGRYSPIPGPSTSCEESRGPSASSKRILYIIILLLCMCSKQSETSTYAGHYLSARMTVCRPLFGGCMSSGVSPYFFRTAEHTIIYYMYNSIII